MFYLFCTCLPEDLKTERLKVHVVFDRPLRKHNFVTNPRISPLDSPPIPCVIKRLLDLF